MQRVLILVVAMVAAGWAQASAAQPRPLERPGEPWLLDHDVERAPSVTDGAALDARGSRDRPEARRTGTYWPAAQLAPRFGSGLEDEAPLRAPNVFLQSGLEGLEGLTSLRTADARVPGSRFGSGLEDDAPAVSTSVFLQSGLEGLTSTRSVRHPRVNRFGSGLEDDAPAHTRKVIYESGL